MKISIRIVAAWVIAILVLIAGSVQAQGKEDLNKTLSPYFFVKADDPRVDRLPLKSTAVQVNIAGVIADVVVTQTYRNEGKSPLEAVYIFPASTRAAVYGMKMTIGERTVMAKIHKRDEARRIYERAKGEGKTASLLEQQRPNVFQMNVANILPGDIVRVELRYTELLIPEDKVYGFVYPTVVGPRYSNQPVGAAPASERWVQNPYLPEGESPTYRFDIHLNISAGLPIEQITCPSHRVHIGYDGSNRASIRLDRGDDFGGNRDFIMKYRLAGKRVESGLLLYEGETENFFLAMLQPPERVIERQIPPREYIFIVDVSGSMHGFPLAVSKRLLRDLIGNLRSSDQFNVLLFAGASSILSNRSLPATTANIRRAIHVIEQQRGGGGTRLLPALKRALALPRVAGISRTVVIATDGYVAVEKEAFELIRNNLGEANVFPFGIGSSVNRYIIEGMARVGMGEPFVVTRPQEAEGAAARFRKLIQTPVLTGIEMGFGNFEVYDVEPRTIPDVMAERPVIVFGKWRGRPKGHIRIQGITGESRYSHEIDVAGIRPLKSNAALRYLWARYRIALLSDYGRLNKDGEIVREITSLGLTYNLMTAYTSFVAVDPKVRLRGETATTVTQPLPLPQGVSNLAVGQGWYACKGRPAALPVAAMKERVRRSAKKEADLAEHNAGLPHTGRKGHLGLELVRVSQGLSKKQILDYLEKNRPRVERCLGNAFATKGNREVQIMIRLELDARGNVAGVKVVRDTTRDKGLEFCMVNVLKQFKFPASGNLKKGTVTILFRLKR
ncbi:MAG: AgmX/PglI C-terminal domain-containing protein [Deltaproteobacteria bacterium]|nr:AgmX/PglI C-terminal domain-containing protein [Deltaproteobacteria bacterium]